MYLCVNLLLAVEDRNAVGPSSAWNALSMLHPVRASVMTHTRRLWLCWAMKAMNRAICTSINKRISYHRINHTSHGFSHGLIALCVKQKTWMRIVCSARANTSKMLHCVSVPANHLSTATHAPDHESGQVSSQKACLEALSAQVAWSNRLLVKDGLGIFSELDDCSNILAELLSLLVRFSWCVSGRHS